MDNIEKKVDEGFERLETSQSELKRTLGDFIEKSENRFASKWVEKAVWGAAALIITSVIVAMLAQVIK